MSPEIRSRRNPRGYGVDLGAITVRDPTSTIIYRPNIYVEAKDNLQRDQDAQKLFHIIKNRPAWLIECCHLMDISVRPGEDIEMLKNELYVKIRSNDRNSHGTKYRDLFIQICQDRVETIEKVAGIKTESTTQFLIQVRVSHTVKESHKSVRDHLRSVLGPIWEGVAYIELKKPGVRDIPLYKNYSCTLFDDETILVFDNTYKPPPPPEPEPFWREEDLVKSELL